MRITILTSLLLISLTIDGFSCICEKVKHRKLFRDSEYVFIGQALKNITPDTITSQYLDINGTGIRISFRVEKVYKGKIDKDLVAIMQGGTSCSMLFDLGDRYLIFGRKKDKIYEPDDIYDPIIRLDSTDTRTDEEVYEVRRKGRDLELKYEQKLMTVYGLMIDTDLCSCFYENEKTFRKYMRRKTHSWQQRL
jgi:hypothetical protein